MQLIKEKINIKHFAMATVVIIINSNSYTSSPLHWSAVTLRVGMNCPEMVWEAFLTKTNNTRAENTENLYLVFIIAVDL